MTAPLGAQFIYDRPVPPNWQAELEAIVPRTERANWLILAWHPGIQYEPVQRWLIYEVLVKNAHVPGDILESCRGKCPREDGQWVSDATVAGGKRWRSNSLVDLVQWRLYQQTGHFCQPFWVIQGTHGGHRRRLSQAEENFFASFDLPAVPNPGELPYAEWDHRVARQIGEADRLRKWQENMATPWDDRGLSKNAAGLWVRQDRRDEERKYAAAMLKWFEGQVADVVSDMPRSIASQIFDAPTGDSRFNADEDELDRKLVEHTATLPED